MRRFLIKSIALSSFLFLNAIFLLFRMGEFDAYLKSGPTEFQSSPNGGSVNSSKKDSLIFKSDSAQIQMLPSSKSIVIFKKDVINDTAKSKLKYKDIPLRAPVIMSSSKSGVIIPLSKIYFKPDSIVYDNYKYKIIKKKN